MVTKERTGALGGKLGRARSGGWGWSAGGAGQRLDAGSEPGGLQQIDGPTQLLSFEVWSHC